MRSIPYTQWNLALLAIWLSSGRPKDLGALLWCNSLAVVASYESVRIINGDAYAGFLRSVSPWREDQIAHWAPLMVLLWDRRPFRSVRKRHVLASVSLELLWAASIGFDLAVPYPAIQPPLTRNETSCVWLCGFLGHIAALRPQTAWWAPYAAWVFVVLRHASVAGH